MNNTTTNGEQLYMDLLSGKCIACYLKEQQPEVVEPDGLTLDTTGEYFTMGNKKKVEHGHEVDKEVRQLLLDNAFYLLEHADRILSDSRMFLAPLDLGNHLAYSGRAGFKDSTLGVYIEWWLSCEGARLHDKEGNEQLVFCLAGSPLTGNNSCGLVDREGNSHYTCLGAFSTVWRPFKDINCRYTEAVARYQSYTLREVLDILKSEE